MKARLLVPLGKRRRAFVKVYDSSRKLDRERVCLEVLQGLAVPRLVELPRGALEELLGFTPPSHIAQHVIRGESLSRVKLTPSQYLGTWLFLSEQLVAFRRHQILYTDLKPSNVMVREKPFKVTQIDFDHAVAANEQGVYRANVFGYTAGYQAPEHGQTPWLREASVVFQLGMLLASGWMGLTNSSLRDPERGLGQLLKRVARVGGEAMAELVADCLDARPERRPQSYEYVLERIQEVVRDHPRRKAVSIWRSLRSPYVRRLREVELVL